MKKRIEEQTFTGPHKVKKMKIWKDEDGFIWIDLGWIQLTKDDSKLCSMHHGKKSWRTGLLKSIRLYKDKEMNRWKDKDGWLKTDDIFKFWSIYHDKIWDIGIVEKLSKNFVKWRNRILTEKANGV